MGNPSISYNPEEWQESAGHYPLKDRSATDLTVLHRHWMWANLQRTAMEDLLKQGLSFDADTHGTIMMMSREISFMFIWYALLWSVIEAFQDRGIDIRGPLQSDISAVADLLRRCRNAVLHVPQKTDTSLDQRIQALVADTENATTVRRISGGFGRLFLEEFQRRTALRSR
jgi:hypothetical protein